MLKALSSLFSGNDYRDEAHALYLKVVDHARRPEFYTEYGVADTLDGRFDMIALHMFLLIDRLKKDGSPEALELLRAVSELFFADMDRSLREMGSTDTGVGKRIKKMSQAFYGRQLAYQSAGDDEAKMQEALLRNLYRGEIAKAADAHKMAAYVLKQRAHLIDHPFEPMLSGEAHFAD